MNPPLTTPKASSTSPSKRFDYLLTLPEVADIGAKVNAAMREIEKHNRKRRPDAVLTVRF